jgi:ubiquinone/menaquinone biosynthesis C-methylase UbiE
VTFDHDCFDKVVAMYVVSVAPDPKRLLEEMRRVCRHCGDLYIVNHFRCANPAAGAAKEEATMQLTSTAFGHNAEMPKPYTCEGKDISPPLAWSGVPAGAKC